MQRKLSAEIEIVRVIITVANQECFERRKIYTRPRDITVLSSVNQQASEKEKHPIETLVISGQSLTQKRRSSFLFLLMSELTVEKERSPMIRLWRWGNE